jgi:sugar phosphate isomerase/epimerase
MQYATQLYSLRSLPPSDRCPLVADAGFAGVELVGLDTDSLALDGVVHETGLDVAAAHVDIWTLESDPSGAVERARAAGTETVVVPILENVTFAPPTVDATASRLDRLAERIGAAGGRLLYHNHEFEFGGGSGRAETDDRTAFEWVVDATTHLGFELDVGWATAAGVDPVTLLDRFGDRIPLVHLKDVRLDHGASRGGVPVDLGHGDVGLRGVLEAADRNGVEWVVFEHDDPADPARTVHEAADWLGLEPSGPR